MKKLFAFVLVLLLALPAYAGAEEAPAAAETVLIGTESIEVYSDAPAEPEGQESLKAGVSARRKPGKKKAGKENIEKGQK